MIYLGGGGSEHDESRLWDEVFVPGARLTVWPDAMPRPQWPATLAWFRQALAPRGDFEFVETGADVLVIPGGNTFDLLSAVRDRLGGVSALLERGGHVYGGSAGAILLGADISIAGLLDPNDIGLTDTTGADLLSGHLVLPHYTPGQVIGAQDASVLAIPETAGVVVDGTRARNVGPSPVHVITPDAVTPYAAGETFTLGPC
ncbi:Type 1 glutamine amidotransferase-like domain-containing protein [Actinoplanes sp. TRM 88003]|uniref:Type 1 glutamine amidotransferase-like domain-containing protein n=1 Tax=Paractinoplanes aksuensis TaxID=2939490 RepID=A0ABT1E2T3_9ACTN|nr:Type 1 glutamine amidotransferase-like domain-containing protein [Actinoplanes aksuensis]MCO8277444.1 Type 1 glutamine amidotransferase-like domain-containing protein [Actinoplanes aksuensis]